MENYEEKYKKALEQAKQAIENIPDKSLISWLENVFPELHENEDERDERVRKELIAFLERKQLIPTETKNEWIAWLEKQGEQILTWSEEDELMIQDAIHWINEFQKSNRCKDENDMQNSVTCENWLKSLKPNHWKPSEEQMEALEPLNK